MRIRVNFWFEVTPRIKNLNKLLTGDLMKLLKTVLTASLLAVTALSTTACSDEEVAFGAGVVIGVIINDDDHHHHRPNPPRYRGRRYYSESVAILSPAETVALKYNLSAEQAEVLTAHLLPARQGDLSGLAALGFGKSDLQALFAGKNPSASTLMTLSETLGLDMEQAHNLIQNIKADALIAKERM